MGTAPGSAKRCAGSAWRAPAGWYRSPPAIAASLAAAAAHTATSPVDGRCCATSGPLSRLCTAAPALADAIHVSSTMRISHESHRRGLELQRATVRGAPSVRSSVHPPATLECEQRRRPVMLLWLEGFSTILAALAMLLLRPASRCQVLLPLTARPACTQPSLTAGCAPCAVGACQPLPFNHHTTRATWLGSATTCSRAAACLVHHVHRGGAPAVLTAPCPRSGGC